MALFLNEAVTSQDGELALLMCLSQHPSRRDNIGSVAVVADWEGFGISSFFLIFLGRPWAQN